MDTVVVFQYFDYYSIIVWSGFLSELMAGEVLAMKETGISKRWLASLLCVFVSLFCVFATSSAASGKEDGETLTVGIPANRCPIFYQDPKTNEIVGIGVDLMRSAAAKTGYHVTFQFVKEKTDIRALFRIRLCRPRLPWLPEKGMKRRR